MLTTFKVIIYKVFGLRFVETVYQQWWYQ